MVGDIKIDVFKNNITTTNYLNMIMSNGLQCMIQEITRENINRKSSTCIDHLLVKNRQISSNMYAGVVTTTISDHIEFSTILFIFPRREKTMFHF